MRRFAVAIVPPSPRTTHPPFSSPRTTHPPVSSPPTTLLDTFRSLHPTKEGAYTCWCTLKGSRKTNYGTRIDYILSSHCLAGTLSRAEVWQHVQGSDHCPVFAEFNLRFLHSDRDGQLPSLCSCWFSGKQSKLSDFMTRHTSAAKATSKAGCVVGATGREGGVADRGVKRTKSVAQPPPPKRTLGQKSLLSFSSKTSQSSPPSAPQTDCAESTQSHGGLSSAWKTVFGRGPQAPPCSGHNEACVLRKVKKQGPNKDRQFWVCARPEGSKGDPQARCDFFRWVKERKK